MDRTELVPQDDYRFLYFPFSECSVDDDLESINEGDDDSKGYMHDHICATVSDVYAGETLEHDFCDEVTEDGIYVEVTEDEPYCTCPVNRDSKVYVVQDGEVVYEEVLSEYGDEFESYFE